MVSQPDSSCIVAARAVAATAYSLAFSFAWRPPWRSSSGFGYSATCHPYIVARAVVVAFGLAKHT